MRKLQSKPIRSCLVAMAAPIFFAACKPEDYPDFGVPPNPIVGQQGNPQVNLHFTNEAQVDMDLYVEDPRGNIIYHGNVSSTIRDGVDSLWYQNKKTLLPLKNEKDNLTSYGRRDFWPLG